MSTGQLYLSLEDITALQVYPILGINYAYWSLLRALKVTDSQTAKIIQKLFLWYTYIKE